MPLTLRTVGAYAAAWLRTVSDTADVGPTTTMDAGASRCSSVAIVDGMPSGRVSSTTTCQFS